MKTMHLEQLFSPWRVAAVWIADRCGWLSFVRGDVVARYLDTARHRRQAIKRASVPPDVVPCKAVDKTQATEESSSAERELMERVESFVEERLENFVLHESVVVRNQIATAVQVERELRVVYHLVDNLYRSSGQTVKISDLDEVRSRLQSVLSDLNNSTSFVESVRRALRTPDLPTAVSEES